ncbi:helix-turn-helix transcriptional regulator [Mobilitalea sibirica]|uniref:Helix-turn-helix transcriptional regulator n=1 Tax=Mobilitalea sibirica TaxID=1462919 RepID=A0A8J7KW45_9FIRM|nr:AraC family transcriptional regulator [Mobilitalea sibirica]MBH1939927.1 helix-turn-helix transcriptional regulator [Mobilitalea sibirica]
MTNKRSYVDYIDTVPYIAHKKTTGNASYPYHRHNACEIFLFLQGNVRFYIEKSCFRLSPNDLFILNPDEMHRLVCDDNSCYERITINITKGYMEHLSQAGINLSTSFYQRPLGKNNIIPMTTEQAQEFIHLAHCLQNTINNHEFGYPIKRDAYASLLLLLIHNLFCQTTNSYTNIMPDYIYETMQFIEQRLDEPINLALLEKQFHLNGNYLSQEFKKHTGITLRAFLLDRKLSRAKSLLSEGKNVTETCYLSGFNDYANFIRSFSKAEGISPGKYKKIHYTSNLDTSKEYLKQNEPAS